MDSLIVSVTESCDLTCRHCSASAPVSARPVLGLDALERFVRFVATDGPSRHFDIVFAGGEPTLAGTDWLRSAVAVCDSVCAEFGHPPPSYTLNSNLHSVDADLAEFLSQPRVEAVSSIDGPPELGDMLRGSTTATVATNVRRLLDGGARVRNVTVVSPYNWNRMDDVIDFLCDLGITESKFNPLSRFGRGGAGHIPALRAEQFAAAKVDVLNRMLDDTRPSVRDPGLVTMVGRLLRRATGVGDEQFMSCHTKYCGYGSRYLAIASSGDVHGCGYGVSLGATRRLGDAPDHFEDDWERRRDRILQRGPRWAECDQCPAAVVCSYGCNALNVEDPTFNEVACATTKLLFAELVRLEGTLREWYPTVAISPPPVAVTLSRFATQLRSASESGVFIDGEVVLHLNVASEGVMATGDMRHVRRR